MVRVIWYSKRARKCSAAKQHAMGNRMLEQIPTPASTTNICDLANRLLNKPVHQQTMADSIRWMW